MLDAGARLLLLRSYLLEHTDERHSATAREIVAYLELSGFRADRRTVYADIELLRTSGLDIRVRRRRANEYYIGSRPFERSELRLLTDMIRASRVLSRERSEAMIEKLAQLCSRHDAAWLRRQNTGGGAQKAENERAFQNAGKILLALEQGEMPGILNSTVPDPACGPQIRFDNAARGIRYAMNNSFGFGGTNCTLVFGKGR